MLKLIALDVACFNYCIDSFVHSALLLPAFFFQAGHCNNKWNSIALPCIVSVLWCFRIHGNGEKHCMTEINYVTRNSGQCVFIMRRFLPTPISINTDVFAFDFVKILNVLLISVDGTSYAYYWKQLTEHLGPAERSLGTIALQSVALLLLPRQFTCLPWCYIIACTKLNCRLVCPPIAHCFYHVLWNAVFWIDQNLKWGAPSPTQR